MKNSLLAACLAWSGSVSAQNLALPEIIDRPADARPNLHQIMDAQETAMLASEPSAGGFGQWYAKQGRPAVVIYFDRQLARVPSGWQGLSRLLIEDNGSIGDKEHKRTITVGMQRNTEHSAPAKGQFAKLFEQSLSQELKRQNVRVLDGVYLQRKLTAQGGHKGSDAEFESLNRSARFVFEVELVAIIATELEVIANLKDIKTGEITTSVRQSAEGLTSASEIDRLTRALVRRLMQQKIP
jgi:hypothetical protein